MIIAFDTICRMAKSRSASRSSGHQTEVLGQHRAHGLEERDVVADAQASSCGTASAKACSRLGDRGQTSRALPSSCARMCSWRAGSTWIRSKRLRRRNSD
jgi:hypothetical protein